MEYALNYFNDHKQSLKKTSYDDFYKKVFKTEKKYLKVIKEIEEKHLDKEKLWMPTDFLFKIIYDMILSNMYVLEGDEEKADLFIDMYFWDLDFEGTTAEMFGLEHNIEWELRDDINMLNIVPNDTYDTYDDDEYYESEEYNKKILSLSPRSN
ncbi:MAG: hypothetical protein IID32_06400 [Planctomycetes bacterium]|nr:hypothetical protein [Planctomycetota bacterium]